MEGIFKEFENENSLRLYPFSAGCIPPDDESAYIPPGLFVDAAIYPVNPSGKLYLSSISEDGVYKVSDNTGVIMTGHATGSAIEFYDLSGLDRHVGTLVASSSDALAEFSGLGHIRSYLPENSSFASSCVMPVVVDGVVSLSVEGSGKVVGIPGFANGAKDQIRVSSADLGGGFSTLRFDVIPRLTPAADRSIRRVICVVDGATPFRIDKIFDESRPENGGYNTVIVRLAGIDKDAVCAQAHREGSLEMADTCECKTPPLPDGKGRPEAYQLEEVYIPPDEDGTEGGLPWGADNAFYLASPNLINYRNPVSITLEDGMASPRTDDLKVVMNGKSAELAEGEMLDSVTSKSVVIQVPGLSGGLI